MGHLNAAKWQVEKSVGGFSPTLWQAGPLSGARPYELKLKLKVKNSAFYANNNNSNSSNNNDNDSNTRVCHIKTTAASASTTTSTSVLALTLALALRIGKAVRLLLLAKLASEGAAACCAKLLANSRYS
ncbi:hypothetical protein AWZ03_010343 [Drosophila navojoa]|uniref:Uncharacterized protein n=1 Tax=Drosophila navojoa TaxID=7232 RepID=A0A484B3M0_DRONA|nr:hypothetical protein AWZ03_010343 [Drosophila navojoa]